MLGGDARGGSAIGESTRREDGERCPLEFADEVDDLLRAAYGEGRDEQCAAALGRLVDDAGQFVLRVFGRVLAVAVSRFDEHVVARGRRFGVAYDRLVVVAEVAGEQNLAARAVRARAFDFDEHETRSQYVAGDAEAGAQPARLRALARVRRGGS